MKYIVSALLVITAVATISCRSSIVSSLSSEARDWGFVQSVGGMAVSMTDPVTLEVDTNVSGLKTVTTEPTVINSALAVRRLDYHIDGNTIYLTVVTALTDDGMSTSCGSIDLSNATPGRYTVAYLDPDGTTHHVGEVNVGGGAATTPRG